MARLAFLAGASLAAGALAASDAHLADGSRAAWAPAATLGQIPDYPQSWQMNMSTAIMICNSTGHVDPEFAARWRIVDIDWNSAKPIWSAAKPMDCEEDMVANAAAIAAAGDGSNLLWVYRNGVKALPWFTTVRKALEDPSQWGLFMPRAGCNPSPGRYTCGPNATDNLYHDFEQTPRGDCGVGVQCGEYVFNHRNASTRDFLLGEYFFGPNGAGNPLVAGFYVDDGWSASGPSEMDANATVAMGMTPADVAAMTAAWAANQAAWRSALASVGRYEWFALFNGEQQTAPGMNQTDPAATCASFLAAQCGPGGGSQNSTLFYGFSRVTHSQAWLPNGTLPFGLQDLALFLLARGPYAYLGYGWTGCVDSHHPFTRPDFLDWDVGAPLGFCAETAPGSGVWRRDFERLSVTMDCGSFTPSFDWKQGAAPAE